MPFTPPSTFEEWQTAYTREDAYRDSERRIGRFLVKLIIFLIALLYCIFIGFRHFFDPIEQPSLWWFLGRWTAAAALVLGLLILFFFIIQRWAKQCAWSFFRAFYCPPEGMNVGRMIAERRNGRFRLPPPLNMLSQFQYILVKDGAIVEKEEVKDRWPAWMACNVGGPILLIVFDGNALYLERGNKFSRVVGPGEIAPFLEWFETIKYVVDLRPKVKVGSFDVWTKDGIKIVLTVRVESRIGDPAKRDPEGKLVYPYDPVAVKKAVERIALRWPDPTQEPSEFTWVDAVWGQVTGILPSYIGSRYLDDLLLAERKSGQILSAESLADIFKKLNQATQAFGVFVTDLQIVKVEIPEEIRKFQEEYWKAERESIITLTEGQAKAFEIRAQEKVKAEAQQDLIIAIADGLEKNSDGRFVEPLLLSLSGILDDSLSDPLFRAYIAKETLDTLEKLHRMLEHSVPEENDHGTTDTRSHS